MANPVCKAQLLGLGNTYLGDDAVGIFIARDLQSALEAAGVTVNEAEIGGFALAELLEGYDRVVIADAVKFGDVPPGTVKRYTLDDFRFSVHTAHLHGVNLPTALEIITSLGGKAPDEIVIVGVESEEIYTFGAPLTAAVAAAISPAGALIRKQFRDWGFDIKE
jgi:hydrogenase maturation protease